eukprot:7267508-Pyramimonas_sp.AAC.1
MSSESVYDLILWMAAVLQYAYCDWASAVVSLEPLQLLCRVFVVVTTVVLIYLAWPRLRGRPTHSLGPGQRLGSMMRGG